MLRIVSENTLPAFEQAITKDATLFSSTLYYQGKPVPYTSTELDFLSKRLLDIPTLAQNAIDLEPEEALLYNRVLLGELLLEALTNPSETTVLGEHPRAKLMELLGHDIVATFAERGNQTPDTTEQGQKLYSLNLELVKEKKEIAVKHKELRAVQVSICYEKDKRREAEESKRCAEEQINAADETQVPPNPTHIASAPTPH